MANSETTVGIVSMRLAARDGVSIEAGKWERAFRDLGHRVHPIAGDMPPGDTPRSVIPQLSFLHPDVVDLAERAFDHKLTADQARKLHEDVELLATQIELLLGEVISQEGVSILSIENALSIPLNLPLGLALHRLIATNRIPAIARHHDLYWERGRFVGSNVEGLLQESFPPAIDWLEHVTINRLAQRELELRKGIEANWLPNCFDFLDIQGIDDYNRDLRHSLGLQPGQLFCLQPTRIVARKGIQRAIELLARLREEYGHDGVLVISGPVDNREEAYATAILREAEQRGVPLIAAADVIDLYRRTAHGRKVYSIADAYAHADLVTFPSDLEGFGNPVIEAAMYRKPLFVNRYPVLADVTALAEDAFEFVTIDAEVTPESVRAVHTLLTKPGLRREIVERNFQTARAHFSFETLRDSLAKILQDLSATAHGSRANQAQGR
jgi:glycosyltransferase involved in cell wall biosynthesis